MYCIIKVYRLIRERPASDMTFRQRYGTFIALAYINYITLLVH